MSKIDVSKPLQPQLLAAEGPVCLIVRATLSPIAGLDRFQPAGFPEIGHVTYDAPKRQGSDYTSEKVCIVDSPASMANHLETVCLAGSGDLALHPSLAGLPHVVCVTDRKHTVEGETVLLDPKDERDSPVVSTFKEGHRLASDYFLDGLVNPVWVDASKKKTRSKDGTEKERVVPAHWEGKRFREQLIEEFGIDKLPKAKMSFIRPDAWWNVFSTIFKYDPNSLVHGVMFAQEQIKISRVLTAHMEAFGARRVGRSGVKFDRLGKTTSGQPIFSVDEETANEIRATFILDLALLRSFGRGEKGLSEKQKRLLLDLALWKIAQLLGRPFRFRTQCHLKCDDAKLSTESHDDFATKLTDVDITATIKVCEFASDPITRLYYPAADLFKTGKEDEADTTDTVEEEATEDAEE